MEAVKKISTHDHPWMNKPSLVKLFNILNHDGLNARMVGGCVRDALLGRKIIDIDMACSLRPEESMKRLEKAGVKVVPTGLKHGTITAVVDKQNFEITALRRDEETYGRGAKVVYIDDWQEDSLRRDFTINALYLDLDGSLYDPCGGLRDIAARRVRFIGDADQRIHEDGLRILRFFRFAAQIGQGEMDSAGLAACLKNKSLIDNLSGERLAQEIFKILESDTLLPVIKVMNEGGILDKVIPNHENIENLNAYVRVEKNLGKCNILARLSCLLRRDNKAIETINRHLKLSNKQVKVLKKYANHDISLQTDMSQKDIRRVIYHHGRDIFIFATLQSWADETLGKDHGEWRKILAYGEAWPIPTFPVQGKDLMARGLKSGAEIGRKLRALELEWVQNDFHLTREEILEQVTR
ncbi:CCA tRNA nucleotidyltransferase [hydrothermal vent metagenome]|uniref:CCA tRNA nucleotidyltransferase n=1 Tax=hydrothermal vent metagenome TaxID=652676 RepID=A0A3B1B2H8_9ZZZZ